MRYFFLDSVDNIVCFHWLNWS